MSQRLDKTLEIGALGRLFEEVHPCQRSPSPRRAIGRHEISGTENNCAMGQKIK